jgi:hypothetical protein
MPSRHAERFKLWQNLTPPQTRALSSAVVTGLLPIVEARGFARVEINLGQPDSPVSGKEIQLERESDGFIDVICFNFEKYGTPRAQVHALRRKRQSPHEILSKCNLVARSTQYYHFWGKLWWLPTRCWPIAASGNVASKIAQKLPQIFDFLERGVRGPNISRQVE